MKLVSFRNLAQEGGPHFSAGQVKALAATYQVKDGPNDAGDMFERPGRPADTFPPPFPNEQAAAAAGGQNEERAADRIAQQTEELEKLVKERDALLKR